MATTWNPSDKGSLVTLSGGDLGVSIASAQVDGVRATASKTSGKWYFEFAVPTVSAGNNDSVGVADSSWAVTSDRLGSTTHSISYRSADGVVLQNSIARGTYGIGANGDVIGIAFEPGVSFKVYRNNVLIHTETVNIPAGATWYPASSGTGGGTVRTDTANFGATTLTYSPPAGYTALDTNINSYTIPVSGGVIIGGTAPASKSFTIYDPSGGVVVGGAGVVSDFYPQHYTIVPSGGVVVGGDQAFIGETHVLIFTVPVSGGVQIGGAAVVKESIVFVPTGGVKVGGTGIVLERIGYQPSGGVLVGGSSASVAVVFVPAPSGGCLVAGSAPVVARLIELAHGGVQVGGVAVVRDFQAWFQPSGGVKVGGTAIAFVLPVGAVVTPENPYNDDFPGWAINIETGAPSRYMRMPANSWTQMGGKTYVANAAGIYEVGATSDAGQPIRAAFVIGQSDYGSEQNKRIPDVVVSARMAGRLRLRVATNTGSKHYYSLNPSAELSANRVKLGKGLEGRFWSWMLENEADGGDFEFESLAFSPDILKRLGK